jgi:hypothetical protein
MILVANATDTGDTIWIKRIGTGYSFSKMSATKDLKSSGFCVQLQR